SPACSRRARPRCALRAWRVRTRILLSSMCAERWSSTMRLSIYDLFTVGVARLGGGCSKGRLVAFIEEEDKCVPLLDLVIPNDLDDATVARFLSERFSCFARPDRRILVH